MNLASIYRRILLERDGPHEHGYVMLFFDFPQLNIIQTYIDENDVHQEGLEDSPHVTLLGGLTLDATDEDVRITTSIFEFGDLYLYNPSLFKNDEYDVLKFDVQGEDLHLANEYLQILPHKELYSEYKPHATIGYLNKGTGQKYVEKFKNLRYKVKPKYILYSKPDGTETKINIKNNI